MTIALAGRAVGLAMGVAVIVVSTIDAITGQKTLTTETAVNLLAIGLAGLGLAALQRG